MMMIVDITNAESIFGDVASDMKALGEEIGVIIRIQKEEIFTKMHRL